MNKLFRRLTFPFSFWLICLIIKKENNNFFSYPLLVYLELNKSKIKQKYFDGKTMTSIAKSRVDLMAITMKRHLNRTHPEFGTPLYDRYDQWCERQEEIQENAEEIQEFIEEYGLNVNNTK